MPTQEIFAKRMARQLKAPELHTVTGGWEIVNTMEARSCGTDGFVDLGESSHPDFYNNVNVR